jgi:hypothetical protein
MKLKDGLFTSPKVYQPPWHYRFGPLLIGAAVVALIGLESLCPLTNPRRTFDLPFFLILVLICMATGSFLYLFTSGTGITTAPEGLIYWSRGSYLYTPWKNIQEVVTLLMGARKVENLHLSIAAVDEPALSLEEAIKEQIAVSGKRVVLRRFEQITIVLRIGLFVLSIFSLLGAGRYRSVPASSERGSPQQYIPVGIFSSHWPSGELWQDYLRWRSRPAR